jgi:hypothetical protein
MNTFQRKTIDRAYDNEHKLSAWELDFIESLHDKPDNYELSEKQNSILNRIGEKV